MRSTDLESRHRKLLRMKDVYTVEVPVFPGREGAPTFPLAYTDSGAQDAQPTLVVIPGGPGFASVAPYAFYRSRVARAGFRVVMVEHRGVGLSRRDARGEDLPVEAMRVEYAARDVVAVLDHLGVRKAWLHGTSYGGYLAQAIGVEAPERVAGMFLDTAMFSAEDGEVQREHNRKLFLRGESPQTARIASLVRALLASGDATDEELTEVVPPVYELFGPRAEERLLELVASGRRTEMEYLHRQISKELDDEGNPFVFDFSLAGAIWYRELVPQAVDGAPFDTARPFAERAHAFPPFEGEPYDLRGALPDFSWPVVLFSGGRDTREPASIHHEMSSLLPRSLHVVFPDAAHDLLRFRTKAVLAVEAAAVRSGLEEAGRVAARVVADSPWHPQILVSHAVKGYLSLIRAVRMLASRRGTALLALIALTTAGLVALAARIYGRSALRFGTRVSPRGYGALKRRGRGWQGTGQRPFEKP